MIPAAGFELRFDGRNSNTYPHGYWHVLTSDGNYDAVGATVEAALANLVHVLHGRIIELELDKK